MLHVEESIKKAVEQGYLRHENISQIQIKNLDEPWVVTFWNGGVWQPLRISDVVVDPAFWQSLGKALGWQSGMVIEFYADRVGGIDRDRDLESAAEIPEWQYHWHRFIDHLAEGGTAESFFETLK